MLRTIAGIFTVACLLLLAACSWLQPSPEIDSAGRAAIDWLRAEDIAAIKKNATETIQSAPAETIRRISAAFPKGEPTAIKRIGYSQQNNIPEGTSLHVLTYEYHWQDRVVLASVAFLKASTNAPLQLHAVNVSRATQAELAANDFSLLGKTAGHYLMLLAVIATPLLMIVAIVMSIRTPGLKRRWLWCLVSLVSFAAFSMNWATGALGAQLLTVSLIGVGVSRTDSVFAPWMLTTAIPVGAIIVIVRLWGRGRRPPDMKVADTAA